MNLNNPPDIEQLDASRMRDSIKELPQQISQTWDDIHALELSNSLKGAHHIVCAGMGGSALGGHVAKHLYAPSLTIPFHVISDYRLPAFVGPETLVIVESYSGTTEEALACYDEALARGSRLITISTGGTLKKKALENGILHFTIQPEHNPSGQPRMAVGYSVFAVVTLLHRLKYISVLETELDDIQSVLNDNNRRFGTEVQGSENTMKELALKIHTAAPTLVSAEHLLGAVHTIRNQIHENAKSAAYYFAIPEMDHHVLESLSFPEVINAQSFYLFINSHMFQARNERRIERTMKAVEERGIRTALVRARASTNLAQAMEIIHMGSYLGFYLAMLNNVDPAPIPHVERFKNLLA